MTAPRKVSRLSQSQVVGYRDRLESPICWTCSKAQGLNTPQRPGIPSRCISAGEAFELDCGTCGKPLLQVAIEFDEPQPQPHPDAPTLAVEKLVRQAKEALESGHTIYDLDDPEEEK